MPFEPQTHRVRALAVLLLLAPACADDGPSADGDEADSAATFDSSAGEPTTGMPYECVPGEVRCMNSAALERCAPTGQAWIPDPCPSQTMCVPCDQDDCTQDQCLGVCDSSDELPSSAGCSFIANRQLHLNSEAPDALVVANPNSDVDAVVQFYATAEGTNQETLIEEVVLAPLEPHTFLLETNFVQSFSSMYRSGGTYRVQSDVPVIAYHHAPQQLARGNDSSLLLPESALRSEYVITSYGPNIEQFNGEPSYFEIVALQNFTTVEWFPRVDTAGNGLPVDFVPVGGRGEIKMNRFDTVRIAASTEQQAVVSLRDVSGTVVRADKPIWVTSGSLCSRVPVREFETYPAGHCDPLQEMPIPLEYWGKTYVAAHSPSRDTQPCDPDPDPEDPKALPRCSDERHWWRVYGATEGMTVLTDPPMDDVPPIVLQERGDYVDVDVPNGTSFVFYSEDGNFMPVQYLQAQRWASDPDDEGPGVAEPLSESTNIGDPAMYQMIPVEQFLSRYVFVTAIAFKINYVQVIRNAGGAEVVLDGEAIDDVEYYPVGDFEISDQIIEEGAHLIESAEPFGIVQVGYSLPPATAAEDVDCLLDSQYINPDGTHRVRCFSSYAHPGGMRIEPIFLP